MDTTNIKHRILVVFGFLTIILFVFSKKDSNKTVSELTQTEQNNLAVIQKIEKGDLSADTDGDGLKNWEEALMGTNPLIQDNPNQNTESKTENQTSKEIIPIPKDSPLNDLNNLTAQFSKNAYTMAGYLDSNGVNDEQTIDEVSKGLISGEITKMLIQRYSEKDLKIVDKNDSATLKNYGNQLAGFVDSSFKVILNIDEEKILNTYTQNKEVKDLSELKTKINSLETLQSNLKNMIVPKLAVQNHLNILNGTASYLAVLKNMNTANTDPIRAVVGYKALPQILLNFFNNFIGLDKFFKENKVTFLNSEKWFVFINKTK